MVSPVPVARVGLNLALVFGLTDSMIWVSMKQTKEEGRGGAKGRQEISRPDQRGWKSSKMNLGKKCFS